VRKTGAKALDYAARNAKIIEMRRSGKTCAAIASKFGINRQRVHAIILAAIKEVQREPAKSLIALENERLDALWRKAYRLAMQGDLQAIAACLRIMERRASLLALDGKDTDDGEQEERSVPVEELRELLNGAGYDLVRKNGEENESGSGGDS
jgi:hypothetical protein